MTIHTAIDLAAAAIIVAQAIAYRRLWRDHIKTVGALWASTLEK